MLPAQLQLRSFWFNILWAVTSVNIRTAQIGDKQSIFNFLQQPINKLTKKSTQLGQPCKSEELFSTDPSGAWPQVPNLPNRMSNVSPWLYLFLHWKEMFLGLEFDKINIKFPIMKNQKINFSKPPGRPRFS